MEQPDNVLRLNLSAESAQRLVRDIAEDSSRVKITTHARQRMRERKITMAQVFCCLKNGRISEPPARDVTGNWKFNICVMSAGDLITAAVALDNKGNGNYAVIITVFL